MKVSEQEESTAWITVASFNEPAPADGLTQLLRRDGVDARVQDERKLQKNWFLVERTRAGVHVLVPELAYDRALHLLETNTAAETCLRQAVHCPSCGSARVQFPQMTRKNLLPTLVAQALVLTGIMKQEYFCETCHYTWRPGKERAAKKDLSY